MVLNVVFGLLLSSWCGWFADPTGNKQKVKHSHSLLHSLHNALDLKCVFCRLQSWLCWRSTGYNGLISLHMCLNDFCRRVTGLGFVFQAKNEVTYAGVNVVARRAHRLTSATPRKDTVVYSEVRNQHVWLNELKKWLKVDLKLLRQHVKVWMWLLVF